ncbi:MAG: nucleoside triphosphate pyrophosphatase [Deferrisomatales bacterium]|nr:nucleoside triphosphate pyrophosphatase [Deferrisomatales bacterium]
MLPLILASTSPARREILGRLGLPFETVAPGYDEGLVAGLGPPGLALRHALGKARAAARRYPRRLVVGSDQVAEVGGRILGKPGTEAAAVDQLRAMAGRQAAFHTGLALVLGDREETALETVRVTLRPLAPEEIEAYVAAERPLDSAGSFRIEGLGIALMEAVEGRDFTALVGLPLIALTSLLERFGVRVLLAGGRGRPDA